MAFFSNKNRSLLFTGSTATLIFSLLAAFIPNLAYVEAYSDFLGRSIPEHMLPRIVYPSFEFGIHMFTLKFAVLAFAGILGLFSLFGPMSKRLYLAVSSIVIANVAFWIYPEPSFMTIPEVHYSIVPWLGCLLVIAGISLAFMGIAANKPSVPRFTFLSVPLLLGIYSIFPLTTTHNTLSLSDNLTSKLLVLSVAGHLLMIWGAYKAVSLSLKKSLKQNEPPFPDNKTPPNA